MSNTVTGWRFQGGTGAFTLEPTSSVFQAGDGPAMRRRAGLEPLTAPAYEVSHGFNTMLARPRCWTHYDHQPPHPECHCGLYFWTHRSRRNKFAMWAMSKQTCAMLLEVAAHGAVPSTDRTLDERRTAMKASLLVVKKVYFGADTMSFAGIQYAEIPEWASTVRHEVVPSLWDVAREVIPELPDDAE